MRNMNGLHAALVVGVAVMTAAPMLHAQMDPEFALAERPWYDRAYGLSIRPPVDCRAVRQTADTYLVRFFDGMERYELRMGVRRLEVDLKLD